MRVEASVGDPAAAGIPQVLPQNRLAGLGAAQALGARLKRHTRRLAIEKEHDMADPADLVSEAFRTFMREAPEHAQAWGAMVGGLAAASALDKKTSALAYLAVLAAQRLEGGIPFHVEVAKRAGASREEVVSALLIGLPAAGLGVTQVLPAAIAAYDAA